MHKNCGFKAFLKLLGLFKHPTNILVGTNVLDRACAKSWGYTVQQGGVVYGQKRGLFWRYTTPLVHLIICGINASRLRTAALFIAAPSVIMANTCFPCSWRSVNGLSINTCDSWVPQCNELGNNVDPDKTLNNLPLFVGKANGDGDSFVLTGRTIEDDGVVVPWHGTYTGRTWLGNPQIDKELLLCHGMDGGVSSDMPELLVRCYPPASRSPHKWSILWRGIPAARKFSRISALFTWGSEPGWDWTRLSLNGESESFFFAWL